ncbi:MAG: Ser-Thr-rich GPI-anchored membrane family protein [Nitrospirota bacterium]
MRPVAPTNLPFKVPNSVRLIDVTRPDGAPLSAPSPTGGFFDPNGDPVVAFGVEGQINNHYVNFGWEYVYHCHLLAHEEMDMMHSVIFAVPPEAPTGLAATLRGNRATLTWLDNSMNETQFTLQRATDSNFTTVTTFLVNPVNGAGSTVNYIDTTAAPNISYYYRIYASNLVGDTDTPAFPTMNVDSAFSNTAVSAATFLISGTVTSGGTGLGGVTMTLSGAANAITTTAADGSYSFAGLSNGNYTVTPTLAGYVFSPSNRPVTIAGANVTGQNFTVAGYLLVTVPKEGEIWGAGSTQTIRWTFGGNVGSLVRIELLKGGVLNRTISTGAFVGTGGNGSFNWLIPSNQTQGNDYTVRVTSTTNAAITDTSNGNFTITGPTITVTAPNGGENWRRSTLQAIRWNYTGNPGSFLKIYLLQGGNIVRTITETAFLGSNGSGSYMWLIPSNLATGNYRIRITSATNAAVTDTSDADFSIVP